MAKLIYKLNAKHSELVLTQPQFTYRNNHMILHMLKRSDWESAKSKGIYHPPSLTEEGFIHCSQPEMIVTVANGLYLGQTDMIILVIDSEMLIAPLIYEDCYETGYAFPHIYGSITPDVVLDVIDFPCKENGEFALPEKLA